MSERKVTISHHLLRRRARERAETLRKHLTGYDVVYRVEKAKRGPWRWRVVAVPSDGIRVPKIHIGADGRPSVARFETPTDPERS